MPSFHGNSNNDKRFDSLALPTSANRDQIRNRITLISVIGRSICVKPLWSPWRRKDQVWFRE